MTFFSVGSADLMRRNNALAEVDGIPTHELADQKYDIEVMLQCCDAEEENYWRQPGGRRLCAAPYYFMRAAILHRKLKEYAEEIAICKRWKAIAANYASQAIVKSGRAAQNHKGSGEQITARIPKARELLKNQ